MARRVAEDTPAPVFRIGEVAKLTGLTTRTLRYWEELGLIHPSAYRGRGERLYSQTDMARVIRIRELQELLGFSLAEVEVVLDTEDIDVLDRVRSEYRWGGADAARRLALLEEAIEANRKLLARLDSTLARIGAFRQERAEKGVRLRSVRDDLVLEAEQIGAAAVRSGRKGSRDAVGSKASRRAGKPVPPAGDRVEDRTSTKQGARTKAPAKEQVKQRVKERGQEKERVKEGAIRR